MIDYCKKCGHIRWDHAGAEDGPCARPGCKCRGWRSSFFREMGRVGDAQWHDEKLGIWFRATPEHGVEFQPGGRAEPPNDAMWALCPERLRARAISNAQFNWFAK